MSLFTSYHNISHADGIFAGNSGYAPGISRWLRDGQPSTIPFRYDWNGVAITAQSNIGLCAQQTLNTALTIPFSTTGSLYSLNGICYMDVPRAIRYFAPSLGTALSIVAYGLDEYGEAITEKVGIGSNVGAATNGKKAFKAVIAVVAKQTISNGYLSVGRADVFGLPFTIAGAWDMLAAWADTTALTVNGTQVIAADTTSPATAKTGDVRGTFAPTTGSNDARVFRAWFTAKGKDTKNNLYGVAQFGGTA